MLVHIIITDKIKLKTLILSALLLSESLRFLFSILQFRIFDLIKIFLYNIIGVEIYENRVKGRLCRYNYFYFMTKMKSSSLNSLQNFIKPTSHHFAIYIDLGFNFLFVTLHSLWCYGKIKIIFFFIFFIGFLPFTIR